MRISDLSSDVCSSDLSWSPPICFCREISLLLLYPPHFSCLAMGAVLQVKSTSTTCTHRRSDRNTWLDSRIKKYHYLRSAERRVGKECVSTVRSRWSPTLKKKKYMNILQ